MRVRMTAVLAAGVGCALAVGGLSGCGPAGPAGKPQGASGGTAPGTTAPGTASKATRTTPAGVNLVDEGYAGRFRAWATVLERGAGGPQLCLGGIATSYPPQCGGPPVVGWDWAKAAHTRASGVRWGAYVVVGRYDGTRFTLTEPPKVDDGSGPRPAEPPLPDFSTPCPEPAGGWVPPDPSKATDDAMNQLTLLAAQQPGYAALWLDQNAGPSPGPSGLDNDPARIVVNVSTTGDVAAMTAALRAVWGGNLCVVPGPRTEAELQRVQTALERTPGMLSTAPDTIGGWVDLTVVRATRQSQRRLDDTYGPGLVRLIGALTPLD